MTDYPTASPRGKTSSFQRQNVPVSGLTFDDSAHSPAAPDGSIPSHVTQISQIDPSVKPTKYATSFLGSSLHPSTGSGKDGASAKRLYRASAGDSNKYVTRDIAALDFLLGIPLAAEAELVQSGWRLQQKQHEEDDADQDSSTGFSPSRPDVPLSALSHGTWWEKYVRSFVESENSPGGVPLFSPNKTKKTEHAELERPDAVPPQSEPEAPISSTPAPVTRTASGALLPAYTPGRRLDGDAAIRIQIPLTVDDTKTKQKSIARVAAIREWERQTAHGLQKSSHPPLLDGRLFFSASGSYPLSVFSLVRYEPRREQAEFRRRKLESLGGGGSQFVMPTRDWRGISYRVLLPRRHHEKNHQGDTTFNRFVRNASRKNKEKSVRIDHDEKIPVGGDARSEGEDDDNTSTSSESSSDSDVYVPGLLDDPDMVLGRHHTVMMGSHETGPIVSSTIQFVKPALLKAELNKQFRERFDGWEPPKASRKYIGAYVSLQEGKYVLKDPSEDNTYDSNRPPLLTNRHRQGSLTSMGSASEGPKETTILRMPPSLTLSKIRSLKQQALAAAVKAKLEVGTVALACVYFERLCLDCRVDKSNRRLSFAACLLIASKINEPNIRLVIKQHQAAEDENLPTRIQSLVRPSKRSRSMFASLLKFFTEEWSLSVKHIFDAEWGVFAALGFSLDATPSQVAFHFKRLMKTLEWNPRHYLGPEMWGQWQDALEEEDRRKTERERKREIRRKRKEEKLLDLQIELENEVLRRRTEDTVVVSGADTPTDGEKMVGLAHEHLSEMASKTRNQGKKIGGMGLFNRFGMRRIVSVERIDRFESASEHKASHAQITGVAASPSMPILPSVEGISGPGIVAIDVQETEGSDASSVAGADNIGLDGMIV